jgi:hypothetical protein
VAGFEDVGSGDAVPLSGANGTMIGYGVSVLSVLAPMLADPSISFSSLAELHFRLSGIF